MKFSNPATQQPTTPKPRDRETPLHDPLHLIEPLHRTLLPRRSGTRTFDSQLDQSLDQPRVLELRRFPQLRVHGDVRKAGDGVDLVDVQPVLAALEKKVDACEAGGADRFEPGDGTPP